ncbi:MAG TPA: TIGR02302 family protein, partial [Beijerinckiaceae bacterium]|nr:TIGR02302 family protein [Beijerinckiaceae bacterium]
WPLVGWRWPGLAEAGRRLDLDNRALHRPVTTLGDRPAGDDPVAHAIWERHRTRAETAAAGLTVPPPVSALPQLDGLAIRVLAGLLVVVSAFVAGDERRARLADALAFGAPLPPPVPPRLDAWVDPPTYTGRAPIFLSGANAPAGGSVSVPAGSILVVRVSPGDGVSLAAPSALKIKEFDPPKDSAGLTAAGKANAQGVFERRLVLDQPASVEVRRGGQSLGAYDLKTIPDLPPQITFDAIDRDDKTQSLKLKYTLDDDYGIARAEALIGRADGSSSRTLVPPPEVALSTRNGENEAPLVAHEHPWAGVKATIRLRATDDLNQSAESDIREAVLPARRFDNKVARALIEQRRQIVMFPDNRQTPQIGLDSLLVAPERFTRKSGEFLMLSIAAQKMRTARTDADLVALAQYLWETAVFLDEGTLTDAERRLRAAEERLREALERGATSDELRQLMDEMRQAMNDMLRDLMERADRNNADRSPNDRNDRNQLTLSQRDLEDMLKRIEELYRSGDTAKAQELLRQLQDLLNNLRSARRREADPRMREMGEALDELDRLQREEEKLRDDTFRNQQRRRMGRNSSPRDPMGQGQQGQRGQRGMQGDSGEDGEEEGDNEGADDKSLAERQQALRDRLKQLRDKLRQRGAPTEEGFDGAEQGMGESEQGLRQGQGGRATQGQQQAIDELGRAGRGLAEQMQREMGDGGEPGEGEGLGPGDPRGQQRGRAENNTDPLGRPLPGDRNQLDNSRVRIPQAGEVRGTIAERAQRVLEELRKRFGEIERPREELDYIERLLRRN